MRLPFGVSRSERLHEPEEPIRAELFSVERLEQHAESLAAAQRVTARSARAAARCRRACATTAASCSPRIARSRDAIREERAITPAAEWLVDNFHIVEEQIREIRDDLPPRLLPPAAEARRRAISRAIRASSASRGPSSRTPTAASIPDALRRFVRAYQRVQPLTIGELWAVAITLRIVLVENLRRARRAHRERPRGAPATPTRWPIACSGSATEAAEPIADVLRRARATRTLPRAFAVQLVQRLRDQDPAVDAGAALARRAARRAGHDRRRDRARGASAPGRDERDGAQHHHQHAADLGGRLDGVLRERQPGRRGAARRQRLRRDGFPDPRSLPARDRGAGARLGHARARGRAPGAATPRKRREQDAGAEAPTGASRIPATT